MGESSTGSLLQAKQGRLQSSIMTGGYVRDRETAAADAKISYVSRPRWRRPAYYLTIVFLCLAWVFAASLLLTSVIGIVQQTPHTRAAVIVTLVALVVAGYLVVFTRKFLRDFEKTYVFEIADTEMSLKIMDVRSHRAFIARMPGEEVSFVEHFTPRDNATLVFHRAGDRIIAVPIWSMTDDAGRILDFLRERNIRIERVRALS